MLFDVTGALAYLATTPPFSPHSPQRSLSLVAMFQPLFAPASHREGMSASLSPNSTRETVVRCGYNDQATYAEPSRTLEPTGALDCEIRRSFAKAFATAQLSEQLRRPYSLVMAHMYNKNSDKTRCTDYSRPVQETCRLSRLF